MILLRLILRISLVLFISGFSLSQDPQPLTTKRRNAINELLLDSIHPERFTAALQGQPMDRHSLPNQRRNAIMELLLHSIPPERFTAALQGQPVTGGFIADRTKANQHPPAKPTKDEIRRYQRIKPIDEIMESAESKSKRARKRSKDYMADNDLVLVEGDIMMPKAEFAERNRHIFLDNMEKEVLQRFVGSGWNSSAAVTDQILVRLKQPQHAPVRHKRAATLPDRPDNDRKWPNAFVPVLIADRGFSRRQKHRIAEAMNEISRKSCVCFRPLGRKRAPKTPHIRIINGNGCWSYIGRVASRSHSLSQDLSLAPGCRLTRIATHQFLHTLGFHHEHNRPDRDAYVQVKWENVRPNQRQWFGKYSWHTVDTRGIRYDYRSIMHYGNRAFSRNGTDTIQPKPWYKRLWYTNIIGRSSAMSNRDAAALNQMYSCPRIRKPSRCRYYPYKFRK